jgi:hypothetical protein
MTAFDDLPEAARALLMAKLRLEIVSANCVNIFDLAQKRNQPISELWHDICRRSKQAHCLMPPQAMETRYTKADPSIECAATMSAQLAVAEPSANTRVAASSSNARGADTVATTARTGVSRMKVPGINGPAKPPRAKTPVAGRPNQDAHHGAVTLATGVGVLLVMGIGAYMMVTPSGSGAPGRPTETIRRIDHAKSDEQTRAQSKQAVGAVNVPPPQGTLRRMDAISKAFSAK